jgi:hypothetical protein
MHCDAQRDTHRSEMTAHEAVRCIGAHSDRSEMTAHEAVRCIGAHSDGELRVTPRHVQHVQRGLVTLQRLTLDRMSERYPPSLSRSLTHSPLCHSQLQTPDARLAHCTSCGQWHLPACHLHVTR